MVLGVSSILCAVSVDPIMLIVFRATAGIGAAMTTPSGMTIITQVFPYPKEQTIALGIFGASGSLGSCSGFIIGGIVSEKVSWRWVFYVTTLGAIPISIFAFLFLPASTIQRKERKIDILGVSTLTAALILFVYALSDGSDQGWGSPQIVTTLVMSFVLLAVFFALENFVADPAISPGLWRITNFAPMFFYSLRWVQST